MLRQVEEDEEAGGIEGAGRSRRNGSRGCLRKLCSDLLSTVVIRNYDELGAHPVSSRQTHFALNLVVPLLATFPSLIHYTDSAALLALCKAGTNFWFAGQAKCLILKRYHCARNGRAT